MPREGASRRARELHENAVVITSHDHCAEYEDLCRMREGGLDAKVCMVHVDALMWDEEGTDSVLRGMYSSEGWARRALVKIERVLRIVEDHPERFLLVCRADDILGAKRTRRSGIIVGFEGGRPLEGSLELLQLYHRLGLRHLQLTWAFGSQICDPATPPAGEISWSNWVGTKAPGITAFGREVIREANRLGIVLDPGHCTRRTYDELLELSEHPVVISHATCRDAGKSAGDVTDDMLKALARNGGVIGMHFFAHYLRDRGATIDDLVDHILHAADVAGINHVGLGTDYLRLDATYLRNHDKFAGLPPDHVRPPDQPLGPLAALDDVTKLPRLTERLLERGVPEGDIVKILGGNLLRVYRRVWGT